MVQIKLFRDHTPDMEKFEKQINAFLSEHKDTIIVKDIKYRWKPQKAAGVADASAKRR